jgi:hypothetical protein
VWLLAKWLEVLGRIKRRYCDDGTIGQTKLPLVKAQREGVCKQGSWELYL